MSSRGNMFLNVANEFAFADRDEIVERTKAAFSDLTMALIEAQVDGPEGIRGDTLYSVLKPAVKCGVEERSALNTGEKRLVDEVFGLLNKVTFSSVPMADYYRDLAGRTEASESQLLGNLARTDVAMPLLRFILGFAYADGSLGDETAAKLEGMFALALMKDFVQSGQESVPAPRIRVSRQEKDIAEWFRREDGVWTVDNVCAHFPGSSRVEVQHALDSLTAEGVLFTVQTFMGKCYALDG